MIETTIYQRLSTYAPLTGLVSDRIYPTVAEENIPALPFVLYKVTASNPYLTTTGISGTRRYVVEIDSYGKNKGDVSGVMSQVLNALHGYRGGSVQGCFLVNEADEEVQLGYHGSQAFEMFSTTANITATQDSTGSITTGNNSVSLQACGSSLTVDCDGITVDDTIRLAGTDRVITADDDTTPLTIKGTANPVNLQPGNINTPAAVVKGLLGQTGDIFQVQNTSGTMIFGFNNNGVVKWGSTSGAPGDTKNAVGWVQVVVGVNSYRLPLYQ